MNPNPFSCPSVMSLVNYNGFNIHLEGSRETHSIRFLTLAIRRLSQLNLTTRRRPLGVTRRYIHLIISVKIEYYLGYYFKEVRYTVISRNRYYIFFIN